MNKTELVNAIANEAKLTKVQAKAALEATLGAVADALVKGVLLRRVSVRVLTPLLARRSLSPLRKWLSSKLVLNSLTKLNKLHLAI